MIDVVIEGLSKEFRTLRKKLLVLNNIYLTVKKGEFFVILGPSGCGKSTFLNILAGLEKPTEGEIWFGEKLVASVKKKIFLTPKERNVAMVFQSYALYPHLSAYDNIAFPLKMAKIPKEIIKKSVLKVAKMLAIEGFLELKPAELSGGQRQRVAIARALVRRPALFLLDEPLSNLDAQLRVKMREELKSLQRQLKVTTIFVTHDQIEAMTLADRLAVIKDGYIQQVGTPLEVYRNPLNVFVAGFIGTPPMNLLQGKLIKEKNKFYALVDDIKIELNFYEKLSVSISEEFILGIRPESIKIVDEGYKGSFKSKIEYIERLGAEEILHVKLNKVKLLIRLTQDKGFREGDIIRLYIPSDNIHIFNTQGIRIK